MAMTMPQEVARISVGNDSPINNHRVGRMPITYLNQSNYINTFSLALHNQSKCYVAPKCCNLKFMIYSVLTDSSIANGG